MIRKTLVIAIVLSVLSCSKTPLELTPQKEQYLASTAYGYSTSTQKEEYVITTFIDSTIQKQSQKALLQSVQENEADNGCVLVMESNTGKVRAMVNLESINGKVIESKNNFAIHNYMEPGSFIKTFDMMALLEDKKADTSSVYSSHNGEVSFYGKKIRDSHEGGYGDLSLGNALVYSSNTIFAQAINNAYNNNPKQFASKFKQYQLGTNLDIPFTNTNNQIIPQPNTSNWSDISLPWMSFGYGLTLSPIQILNYYNTIANGGEVLQPLFLSEIKNKEGLTKHYEKKVLASQISSKSTIVQIQDLLRNVVVSGTGLSCKSERIAISGKTTSVQINYGKPETTMQFSSGFVGYFPSSKPKYSIIVILSNPKKSYYGADVAGVVVKKIAEKLFGELVEKIK
jgi:cell division protein FtsI (penicillin-binding protein 3)